MNNDISTTQDVALGPPARKGGAHALARALGVFSLVLGVVRLVAPQRAAVAADSGERGSGEAELPQPRALMRTQGARDVGIGVGLLNAAGPEAWVRSRVAGDVADLAAVALLPRPRVSGRLSGGSHGATLLAVTAVDVYCALALHRDRKARDLRLHDWSRRSGFPRPAGAMRNAASDFVTPGDMRTPALLRPGTTDGSTGH